MRNCQPPSLKSILGPSDFDLFGPLKEALRGQRRFVNYDKLHEAVHDCLHTQLKICYFDAFKKACRSTGKMQWETGRQCWEICNVRKINKDMWGRKGGHFFKIPHTEHCLYNPNAVYVPHRQKFKSASSSWQGYRPMKKTDTPSCQRTTRTMSRLQPQQEFDTKKDAHPAHMVTNLLLPEPLKYHPPIYNCLVWFVML
jgi:hypothetical protein